MAKKKEKAKTTVASRVVVAMVEATKPGKTCFCVRDPARLADFGVQNGSKVSLDQSHYGLTKRFLGTIADLNSNTNFCVVWDDEPPARLVVGRATDLYKAS